VQCSSQICVAVGRLEFASIERRRALPKRACAARIDALFRGGVSKARACANRWNGADVALRRSKKNELRPVTLE
jgi:hypothetical protein